MAGVQAGPAAMAAGGMEAAAPFAAAEAAVAVADVGSVGLQVKCAWRANQSPAPLFCACFK
jgi:hypothetical protein